MALITWFWYQFGFLAVETDRLVMEEQHWHSGYTRLQENESNLPPHSFLDLFFIGQNRTNWTPCHRTKSKLLSYANKTICPFLSLKNHVI